MNFARQLRRFSTDLPSQLHKIRSRLKEVQKQLDNDNKLRPKEFASLSNKQEFLDRRKELVKEKGRLYIQLKNLNCTNEYFSITKDYLYYTYY